MKTLRLAEKYPMNQSDSGVTDHKGVGHHQSGMDVYSERQFQIIVSAKAGIQPKHILRYRQPGPYRPLGIVFVGLRVAKIYDQAVAKYLGAVPFKSSNSASAYFLVAA